MTQLVKELKTTSNENSSYDASINVDNWVELYGDILFRFALFRVKERELAKDLVQDTFLSAIRAFDSFKHSSSIKTWLIEILKNKIIDYFRSSNVKKMGALLDSTLKEVELGHYNKIGMWSSYFEDWAANPEKHLQNQQFFKALKNCLDKLPEVPRRAFLLKNLDSLESNEVCNVLGLSSSNYWVIMHRARLALRDCIEKNWIALSK